jgi:hypothetical protein
LGARPIFADLGGEVALDVLRQFAGTFDGFVARRQIADHFVDRQHFAHRCDVVDGPESLAVIIDIQLVARHHQLDIGNQFLRLADIGERLDAEFPGFITGGDQAGGIGQHRHHAHRLAAQFGPRLLLAGGEVGIEIDEKGAE